MHHRTPGSVMNTGTFSFPSFSSVDSDAFPLFRLCLPVLRRMANLRATGRTYISQEVLQIQVDRKTPITILTIMPWQIITVG